MTRSRVGLLCMLPLVVACHSHQASVLKVFDSADVEAFDATIHTGDVFVAGQAERSKLAVRSVSVATGSSDERAEQRQDRNAYSVVMNDRTVHARAESSTETGYVDFFVESERNLDVAVDVMWGHTEVFGVHGNHRVHSESVTLRDVSGSADLSVYHGILDAQIHPDSDGVVRVVSDCGPVSLGLPRGLDYDLRVRGDFWFSMDVEDLGFDWIERGGRQVEARSGDATVVVEVEVDGASLEIYALD